MKTILVIAFALSLSMCALATANADHFEHTVNVIPFQELSQQETMLLCGPRPEVHDMMLHLGYKDIGVKNNKAGMFHERTGNYAFFIGAGSRVCLAAIGNPEVRSKNQEAN